MKPHNKTRIATAEQVPSYENIYNAEYSGKQDVVFFRSRVEALDARRILEIGCGTGRIYDALRDCRNDLDYAGIDYSGSALADFRRSHPDVDAIEGVFPEDMPLRQTAAFDAVLFTFNGLSYIEDLKRVGFFEGCRAVLKEGGHLLLHFFRYDPSRIHAEPITAEPVKTVSVGGVVFGKHLMTEMLPGVEIDATRRLFIYRALDRTMPEIVKEFHVYPCRLERVVEQLTDAGFKDVVLSSSIDANGYDPEADDVYLQASAG